MASTCWGWPPWSPQRPCWPKLRFCNIQIDKYSVWKTGVKLAWNVHHGCRTYLVQQVLPSGWTFFWGSGGSSGVCWPVPVQRCRWLYCWQCGTGRARSAQTWRCSETPGPFLGHNWGQDCYRLRRCLSLWRTSVASLAFGGCWRTACIINTVATQRRSRECRACWTPLYWTDFFLIIPFVHILKCVTQ